MILVVPCYNEEQRLPVDAFARFLAGEGNTELLFVDDGSRDRTAAVIESLCARFPARASLLRLPSNRGKGEAVRHGILAALERAPDFVGFWDADLATPLDELPAFLDEFARRPELEMVLGSRVLMLGRHIERHAFRHYVGRVFATIVSWILRLPTYDTQCGAKLFRTTPTLSRILAEPFASRWVFDVEILARLSLERAKSGGARVSRCVSELPLHAWRDVPGSKIGPSDLFSVARDLWRIHTLYGREIARIAGERAAGRVPVIR
jgi:glycosyltransferase involved in cell wall biosynthesis